MFLCLSLIFHYCTLAASYFPWVPVGYLGQKDGHIFELHKSHHLLLVRDRGSCYFIRATNSLTSRLTNDGQVLQIQDDILKQIRHHVGIERAGLVTISQEYTDAMATSECVGRQLYLMRYHHSGITQARHGDTHHWQPWWSVGVVLPV
ncbi:uncharacterized protein LOC121390715 [Gigantopelta aegis]|uniref:uncharacterized protein LOC121390715 n=1 Tax=Gigantopelta aegis TaxID=1735272 RepID=UPI001B88B60D|nr:uncharacterized protein LOC121390715 [Gigantopelta aegis]